MAESPLDVIKSYMVQLGFEVDKTSFEKATKSIDGVSKKLEGFASQAVTGFAKAGIAVAGFIGATVVGIAKFVAGLGEAQIKYEMLAHQMWTTQQNAQAFDTTLKAMGVSLQELYLSPTLMAQFQMLHKQAFQMMPPSEYRRQMQFIQSIVFEFKRLKLEGTYALQWIGYYFVKYMYEPLASLKNTLSNINDTIVKTMPSWTKVVAEVMSWFAKFGVTAVKAIKDIDHFFSEISKSIPKNVKKIGAAIAAVGLAIELGPIGVIIAAFLLLQDFYTYLQGGQSEFAPLWKGIMGFYDRLKKSGAIKQFKKDFEEAMQKISTWIIEIREKLGMWELKAKAVFNKVKGWIGEAANAVQNLYNKFKSNGTLKNLEQTAKNVFTTVKDVIKGVSHWASKMFNTLNQSGIFKQLGTDIVSLIKSFSKLMSSVTGFINKILGLKGTHKALKNLGDILTYTILGTLQTIDNVIKEITSGMNVLADLFQGKFGKAWKDVKNMLTGQNLNIPSHTSYLYPNSSKTTNNNHSSTNNNVSLNPTYNIYGSDPSATANSANNNLNSLYMRSLRGMIY